MIRLKIIKSLITLASIAGFFLIVVYIENFLSIRQLITLDELLTVESLMIILLGMIVQRISTVEQSTENQFFKLLEIHKQNITDCTEVNLVNSKVEKGLRCFVVYRIVLFKIYQIVRQINSDKNLQFTKEEVIDISFNFMFYGVNPIWKEFLLDIFDYYQKHKISLLIDEFINKAKNTKINITKTRLTFLSIYFNHLFLLINFIDKLPKKINSRFFKIIESQLSMPEKFILYVFHKSSLSKKWKENKYFDKYAFWLDLPRKYLLDF